VPILLETPALLLALAICSYTEFNPQKGSNGFPHRLFVLPITSFQLVAVPMIVSVAGIEVISLAWVKFILPPDARDPWIALLLGVYVVLFQTILWTLPGLRSMRMLVLGLTGVTLIMLPIFPFVQSLSNTRFIAVLVALAIVAFLTAWICVARQRSGAVSNLHFVKSVLPLVSDRLLRRHRAFRSANAAQFWFEWRRSGLLLPLLVGSLLAIVTGPLSWYTLHVAADSLRILIAILLMPMLLALAIGKAFSRPDFWSSDLSIPGFIAVRPLSTFDMVATKLKVAALSTVISWLLVLAFLSLWFAFWANLDSVAMIRGLLWQIHRHSVYPQYAIAALGILTTIFLTWRFLVSGLWLGLSGNNRLFALSAIPYVLVPLFGLPATLVVSIRFHESLFQWLQVNLVTYSIFVWIATIALVAKVWIAAFSWRKVRAQCVRAYLLVWAGGTVVVIALAILLRDMFLVLLPSDTYRLRNLLVLIAVQVIPLARICLAPTFLARNRHR